MNDNDDLARSILDVLDQTAEVTGEDILNGSVDILIENTVQELGEFCTAFAVEQGRKEKELTESSKAEAVDTIICALALYYSVRGTHAELPILMQQKLLKWRETVARRRAQSIKPAPLKVGFSQL